jgi:hypothetical protein
MRHYPVPLLSPDDVEEGAEQIEQTRKHKFFFWSEPSRIMFTSGFK